MNYSTQIAWEPTAAIKKMQEKKLRETLVFLQENSPFYKDLFQTNKINTSSIGTLADLHQLPITTKEDLQQRNDDFLCVPKNKIIEYTSTSGTLGSPVTIALTATNLPRFVQLPDDKSGRLRFIPLEDLIANHLQDLFPGMEINEHHVFLEKYNVVNPEKPPQKGVYPSQTGFGWTNAVFERFCQQFVDKES